MKVFNKKRLIISGVLIILIVMLILLINSGIITYSKYETNLSSQNALTTAVYLLDDTYQTINVKLPDVIPGNMQYTYSFSVSNYNNDAHSDTNLKYRIHIRTTTNMDIEYDLFPSLTVNGATSDLIPNNDPAVQDSYGTYFNHFYTNYKTMLYSEDRTDNYTLLFTFPNDFIKAKYSGIAELIEINIESNQIMDSDI